MVKFDQQLNANHTWGIRWLREFSPQRNQAITPRLSRRPAIREEDDKDQTVVGTFSLRLRQHEVNSLRVGWTQERRGVRQSLLQRQRPRSDGCAIRRWRSRPSTISRTTLRRRASTTPIRSRTRSPGSCPTSSGDHDVKFGVQFEFVSADNLNQGNLNGTFSVWHEQRPVRCRRSTDLSGSPDDSRSRAGPPSSRRRTTCPFFAQDKWKIGNRLTATISASATTAREFRSPRRTIRSSPTKTTIRWTRTTSSRASACPMRSTMLGVRSPAADTAGSSTRRTSRSSAASSTAACSRTRLP